MPFAPVFLIPRDMMMKQTGCIAVVKELSATSVSQVQAATATKSRFIAKILWVDPHPANNIGLQYAFQSLGMIVVTVQDDIGIEPAFQTAGNFDVVITNMARDSSDEAGLKTVALLKQPTPKCQ